MSATRVVRDDPLLTSLGENHLSFIETSALDASNVELAFQNILTGKLAPLCSRVWLTPSRDLPHRVKQSARQWRGQPGPDGWYRHQDRPVQGERSAQGWQVLLDKDHDERILGLCQASLLGCLSFRRNMGWAHTLLMKDAGDGGGICGLGVLVFFDSIRAPDFRLSFVQVLRRSVKGCLPWLMCLTIATTMPYVAQ